MNPSRLNLAELALIWSGLVLCLIAFGLIAPLREKLQLRRVRADIARSRRT